jgi:hypothetical protein
MRSDEATYPQSDLASLEELETQEGASRQVVHGSLSVRWSPEMLHLAKLFKVISCLSNAQICLITAGHEDSACLGSVQCQAAGERNLRGALAFLMRQGRPKMEAPWSSWLASTASSSVWEICVSKCLVVDRRCDGILTWNCTKAAGMFFLSKRTLTQHGPICAKVFLTASVRSIPLRVRSRLMEESVKAFMHV